MAPDKILDERFEPHDAQQAKNHHKENDEAAVEAAIQADRDLATKNSAVKTLKRKVEDAGKRVDAKKAKVVELKNALRQAEDALRQAEDAHHDSSTKMSDAIKQYDDLMKSRLAAEKVKKMNEVEKNYDINIDAAKKIIDATTPEIQERLNNWARNYFQEHSGCLFYPAPRGAFVSEAETRKDEESEVGSVVSDKSLRKAVDAIKEGSGMVQRLNNPMYLVDRVVDFVIRRFADASAQAPTPGTTSPPHAETFSGGELCFMLHGEYDKLSSAPQQILLSALLHNRLDQRANEIIAAASGSTMPMLKAMGIAAKEIVPQWKAKQDDKSEFSDEKLRRKVLASASTGRLFKEMFEFYGPGILIVIPLAEFFNYNRKQKADTLLKGKIASLVELVNPRSHDVLVQFLKALVNLVKDWIDCSGVAFSLIVSKVNDKAQFMKQVRDLRERYKLPTDPSFPFSRIIDVRPVERWELMASTSGWDITRDAPLVIFKDNPSKTKTVDNPQEILGDILGGRYSYSEDQFSRLSGTEIGVQTMEFLNALLPVDAQADPVVVYILDCGEKKKYTINGEKHDTQQSVCVLWVESVWVVVLLIKPEAGHCHVNMAVVFAHTDEGGMDTKLSEEAIQSLGLSEDVMIAHVNVPRPQKHASGIHALCHMMAIRNLGHHWVTELTDDHIMDTRHALLRATSMAFIRAAATKTDEDENAQDENAQGSQDGDFHIDGV